MIKVFTDHTHLPAVCACKVWLVILACVVGLLCFTVWFFNTTVKVVLYRGNLPNILFSIRLKIFMIGLKF